MHQTPLAIFDKMRGLKIKKQKRNTMLSNPAKGHLLAIFTILVWGVTFSSTKLLLPDFAPTEILFIRFFIAYAFLSLLCVKLHTTHCLNKPF